MPESTSSLILWRNTIQLFHEYLEPKFVGPFKSLKFKYVIERLFSTIEGEKKTPDIVASGDTGWLILELTNQLGSKGPKLDSYESTDPRDLGQYGLNPHDCKPDVIISRLSFVDDGNHCQIIVKDRLIIRKIEYIENKSLQEALSNSEDIDLKKLPELPINLIPDMEDEEIPLGLVSIVVKIFQPNSDGMTPSQIVKEGLERIYDNVGISARQGLEDKVRNHMRNLITNYLSEYLKEDKGIYRFYKSSLSSKEREKIARILEEWTKKPQLVLEDFGFPTFDLRKKEKP